MRIRQAKQTLLWMLLLIPFFKPVGPAWYGAFNALFQGWKLAAIVCLAVLFFATHREGFRFRVNEFFGLYLFWIIYILNCFRYGNSAGDILNNALTSFVLLNLIAYASMRPWREPFLRALSWIFVAYLLLQCASMVVIHSGHLLFEPIPGDYTYFLGTDNYSAFAVYPMLGVVLFCDARRRPAGTLSRKSWLLSLVVTMSFLYVRSMTAALAGMVLLLALFLRDYWGFWLKLLNIRTVLCVALAVFLPIHYGHIQLVFSSLLEGVLHKGVTLNSRTIIWENAVNLIKQKPLLGFGALSQKQIDNYVLFGTTHAHNLFLELLLRTGIVGTAGYLVFLAGFARTFPRRGLSRRPVSILLIFLIVQVVLFSMDFYATIQYFYCFMGVLYYGGAMEAAEKEVTP